MRLHLDEDWIPTLLTFKSETAEGSSNVIMERSEEIVLVTGKTPEGSSIRIKKEEPADTLLGSFNLASFLPITRRIGSLNVGDTIDLKMLRIETDPELEIAEIAFRFERRDDVERSFRDSKTRRSRVYAVSETKSNGSWTGSMFLDEEHRLMLLERVEQMGVTRFELVETGTWTERVPVPAASTN